MPVLVSVPKPQAEFLQIQKPWQSACLAQVSLRLTQSESDKLCDGIKSDARLGHMSRYIPPPSSATPLPYVTASKVMLV
jgi:hypothetical protein